MLLSILVGCGGVPPDTSERSLVDADAVVTWARPLADWAPTGGLTAGATGGLALTFDVPDAGAGVPVVALLDGPWTGGRVAESDLDVGLAEPLWPGDGYLASGTFDGFGRRYLAIGREDRVTLLVGPLTGWVGQESEQADVWVGRDVSPVSSGARGRVVADVTGDGGPDLVLAQPAEGRVDLLEGPIASDTTLDAAWATWTDLPAGWLGPGADLDGDGAAELLAGDGATVWVLGAEPGVHDPSAARARLPGAAEAVAGDWTGDGVADLAATGADGLGVYAGPLAGVVEEPVVRREGVVGAAGGDAGLWVASPGEVALLPIGFGPDTPPAARILGADPAGPRLATLPDGTLVVAQGAGAGPPRGLYVFGGG